MPHQTRNRGLEQVAAGVRFEKVREPDGRRVGVVPQPALNVVVHGIQHRVVQQNVLPRGTKVQRSSLWPQTPPWGGMRPLRSALMAIRL